MPEDGFPVGEVRPLCRRAVDGDDGAEADAEESFAAGEADPTYPAPGTVVDRAGAARALRAAFLRSHDDVVLPTEVDEPTVSKDAVSRAMDGFANPAMSGAVVVRIAGVDAGAVPDLAAATLAPLLRGTQVVLP